MQKIILASQSPRRKQLLEWAEIPFEIVVPETDETYPDDLSLDDIAVALKIPISHVNFIFKYHCNESFTDYKKIVRIHDATKLLEGGYLNNQKIESLAAEVGFSTYNTFHLAFKNITGLTANEYAKRF